MVKIRLLLAGKKHEPRYRIAVVDSRAKRSGKTREILGYFNPQAKPVAFKIEKERFNYWLSVGAQMSEAVRKIVESS